jgi:hypothetical protein
MAKVSLSTMDIQSLMDLRKRIDQRLLECRADIEKQLARLDSSIGDKAIGSSSPQQGATVTCHAERQPSPSYPSTEATGGTASMRRIIWDGTRDGCITC